MTSTPGRLPYPGRSIGLALAIIAGVAVAPAAAGTASGPFRLAAGHAARQEVCFTVGQPGPVRVTVHADRPEDVLQVTLYAGQTPVRSAQGPGRVALEAQATDELLKGGREWAVVVTGASREAAATGRIEASFPDAVGRSAHHVDEWLRAHPTVAYHLVWNEAGQPLPYSAWPDAMPRRLWALVDQQRAGRPSRLDDPPPNAWQPEPGEAPGSVHTAFPTDVAREIYLTTVAHALRLEIDRLVPWSLDDLNGDELDALMASASLFWWNPSQQAYEISEFDHGWAVPAAPETAWRFLQDARVLGPTRLATVANLVGWAARLTHFSGPVSLENFRDHWGYAGDMPVSRALSGTRYTGAAFRSAPGYDRTRHYTAGCHGTAGLLVSVLRAANIPARTRSVSNASFTHATVVFLSEDRALSHGDDPYSQLAAGAPAEDLLIDLPTYERWLGSASRDPGRFIGRQAAAVGLARLPEVVRRAAELDRQQGAEPAQSAVFALFRDTHTIEELHAAGLWERLGSAASATDAAGDDRWLEAEDLNARVTVGEVDAPSMEGAGTGTWRGSRQLRWQRARPGGELTLPFTVPAAGVYRLSVRFTRTPDSATVAVALAGGRDVLDRVSLYAPFVLAADPLPMGEHELPAGAHALVFTVVGAHPQAAPGYSVGIDAIRVERLR